MNTNLQLIDVMSPGGNLDAYIQTVNTIPMLSADQERELTHRLYFDKDLDAAKQLVFAHLRFVVYVAKSYSGYGLSEADLIQEGNVGLMKAVRRFNPEFKVRLVSFAVHWIKAEMHEFILRNWKIVKVATTKAQRKLFFNLRSAKRRLGWMNSQEVSHVAQALGVEPEIVRQMEGRLASHDESFDASNDDDDSLAPSHYLDDGLEDPALLVEHNIASSIDRKKLIVAFKELDARAREIVQSRWLTEKKSTLHELADQFGISAERVRQLEKNALKKLRLSFET